MKTLIAISILLSILTGCSKDETVKPVYNSIRMFPDYNSYSDSLSYSYDLFITDDSIHFDTTSVPVKVYSGTLKQLWNGTFYESVQIDMEQPNKVYIVGYRTPVDTINPNLSSIRKYLYFVPDTNYWIELPVTKF